MYNERHINSRIQALGHCIVAVLLFFVCAASTANAQSGAVLTGVVVDSIGTPIPGAIVNIGEYSKIVVTDNLGNFTLNNARVDEDIFVSCVGYISKSEPLEGRTTDIKIVLTKDDDPYIYTQPVGFQRKEKRILTEAISVVSGEELQKHPITVLQNAFTSTVNGVETYEWSSEPGWTETQIYIRGIRTMNSGARNPLIIVDNVERDMSFLDAFPIENITILKDAAATAIYGMRGANGVILVTTKRGEQGKTKIDFTQEIGFQMLSDKMEMQNSYNMALTRNRVKYLDGAAPVYTQEQIEKYKAVSEGKELEGMDKYRYFNTNWFDVLYREKAPTIKTNLQISGGNDRARYYVSFSYLRQTGVWNDKWTGLNKDYDTGHTLDRYNLRTNIDIDVTKFLNVRLDLGGRIDNISQPLTSVFNLTTFGACEANPMEPVYCPNGEIYASSSATNAGRLLASSGQDRNRRRNIYTTVELTGDLSQFVKGLKLNAVASFDAYETFQARQSNDVNSFNYNLNGDWQSIDEISYKRFSTYAALSNPSAAQRDFYSNINLRAGVSYDNTIANDHTVSAQAFVRAYRNTPKDAASSSVRNLSFNGQLTYDFQKKYVLSANISRMANDNYAPEQRWGTFWGTSAAWILSNESFLEGVDFVKYLKLRGSYGLAGQSETNSGRYQYQSTYGGATGYRYGLGNDVGGYAETRAGNANNIWEESRMVNVGLDLDLFNGMVYGAFDAFKEWRSGILVTRSNIPDMMGISVAKDSYGKAETKGWELKIGHTNKVGVFEYYAEANLTFNENKITEMDELEPNVEWQRKTGKPIYDYTSVQALYESSFNGTVGGWNRYKFVQWASDPNKIATSQQDAIDHPEKYPYHFASSGAQPLGTAVFKDINGDRLIDDRDMVPDSYTIIPRFIPQFTLGFKVCGFDARAVVNAYLQRDVFLSPAMSFSGWSNMGTHEVVNSWGYYTDDPSDSRNVNAKYPRPTYGGFQGVDSNRDNGTYCNDIWIKNGNFWSLRNVEVGYSLPLSLISKVNMTKCRVYFQGYNLKTWHNLPDGVDPEKPMSYCWWYPKTRTFTVGINLGF